MATVTFSIPSFRAKVGTDRVLNLQFLIHNPEGQQQFTHEVSMRSLVLTEAHNTHDAVDATRVARHLRMLANDLDALAHEWTPPLEEPDDADPDAQ